MLNQEQQQAIINLRVNPGWKLLEKIINDQMSVLRGQLENDKMVVVGENQAELKAYKFILRTVGSIQDAKQTK